MGNDINSSYVDIVRHWEVVLDVHVPRPVLRMCHAVQSYPAQFALRSLSSFNFLSLWRALVVGRTNYYGCSFEQT